MKQQPYTQEDLAKVAEFATITLRAIAPRLQDVDLSSEMEVDCMASDIAKACYAMGICMIEEHENARLAMGKANKELHEDNK